MNQRSVGAMFNTPPTADHDRADGDQHRRADDVLLVK